MDKLITPNLANRGSRFVAFIIDAVIIGVVNSMFSGFDMVQSREDSGIFTLIGALYCIIFWIAWKGQTPGKRIMGMKIVKEDGTPFSTSDAIVRYVGYIISAIVLSLGFIWILFDAKKQGWHDKIAKTLVVTSN